MREYVDLGHMHLAPHPTPEAETYYIPHHPVFKKDSTTSKLRVAFDASAKSTTRVSLNDTLCVGPTVQPDLFSTVLRFRTWPIAFAADVSKMYRQILLNPAERDLQRILWRDKPTDAVQEYVLNTVTYGTASAAFLATRTLNQVATDECLPHSTLHRVITNDFYIDDLLSGAHSPQEAIELAKQLSATLQRGGFELRKWTSNSVEVIKATPPHLRETKTSKPLSDTQDSISKTLGLIWNASRDELRISCNLDSFIQKTSFTKRQFLSCVASIFDPLGLIAPVTTSAKILFQRLWLEKLDWDDTLPPPS